MDQTNVVQTCNRCSEGAKNNHNNVKTIIDENNVTYNNIEKCQQWLTEKCSISEIDSECDHTESVISSSVTQSEFSEESENALVQIGKPTNCLISENFVHTDLNSSKNSYGEVSISNSKHVVIGNVTYVTGPVHVTQTSSNVHEQKVVNQIFLENSISIQKSDKLRIISRLNWLAQPPFSKIPLSIPVRYIIITHTATEEGLTQAKNTLIVRLVQTFHIESRNFVDISYNFLIGSDGLVYEGRGWDLQGEHTHGYNEKSIAISFVGCFMEHLPPDKSMIAAKTVIQHGIELGYISKDYILCGHCQCLPIESPGRRLYDEIKTWPHWKELSSEDEH